MPLPENAGNKNVSRKINFLMNLMNVQNAQLARALCFDASYISRVRAGKRGLPSGEPFIEPASAFFARNVHEEYQKEALARELGAQDGWPDDKTQAAQLISRWLEGAEGIDDRHANGGSAEKAFSEDASHAVLAAQRIEAKLFFGEDGRRKAALAFLEHVADAHEPCELLLQSDEDTTWMYEDAAFADEWAGLMTHLAEAGCTFTVVHTVSRGGNEMWEGVRRWLPLYLTGAIRPYYYPRLRDGVRARSLFVARGRCALVSNSVRGMQGDELCIMLDERKAASALTREFDAYLKLCEPLAQLERPQSRIALDAILEDFRSCDDAVAAEVSGAVVCARVDRGAIVASPGERPVVYCIAEPRLIDALSSFVDNYPGNVSDPEGIEKLFAPLIPHYVS